MSIIEKNFCYANRYVLIALVALMGFAGSSAMAQVAPQLLPYSVKVIAGGGTTGTSPTYATPFTAGECGPSGNTPLDIYGDGCLATEIGLTGPRNAVADVNGNVFFTDYTNGMIRRVDAITGVVTAVAGGVADTASPGAAGGPTTCVVNGNTVTPSDVKGDGCLGTQVFLIEPIGITFSPAGDLYFTEYSNNSPTAEIPFGGDVRKIAATNGLITTTGVISMVDGALSNYTESGYAANPATCTPTSLSTCIIAATQSYLYAPYGLAFDTFGNLYIADEHASALLVVNTNPTGYNTVAGVQIPAGTVAKIAGYPKTGGPYCPNGVGSTSVAGCYGNSFTNGNSANSSPIYDPYSIALGPNIPGTSSPGTSTTLLGNPGNIYFVNEFNYDVAEISSTATSTNYASNPDVINNFAGVQGTGGASKAASITERATAGSNSFSLGSAHGIAVDGLGNAYVSDSYVLNGTTGEGGIWRVDSADNIMYLVAGGAITFCTTSIVPGVTTIDAWGDGCPALQATFGEHAGTTGVFGVSVDNYSDLFVGDTLSGRVREVASGTQFGPIGANQPTQYVDIHFASGDGPAASGAYTLAPAGAANFSLGTATCTLNSDNTKDCVLPIKATPSVVGPFTGTLEVDSLLGGSSNPFTFPLSGDFVASPLTRTVVNASQAANCTNTAAYNTTTPVILTATVFSSGANPPGGTVTFYANGTQIGSPVNVNNNAASLTYTFSTAGPYAITAIYSGDSYYKTSTSGADNITSSAPSFAGTAIASQQNNVVPGQTALYSFTLQQNVFAGTLTFACSGLPANSSCVFYPNTITASGCQTSNTIAMSIITQASAQTIAASSLGGVGRGWKLMLGILPGLGLALLIGLRRRKVSMRYGQIWMALALLLAAAGITSCNASVATIPATPAGTSTVTVTITGSTGTPNSFTVPLTVR